MNDYLVRHNHTTYQRRNNGDNSGTTIGDRHHGPGEIWAKINMIDLEAA